ncbi:hypothetical protein HDC33_001675 [Sporosarcina sp. JAI121]|nr:hypothetical protein [Sporosarcina sp. JAI121]
MEAVIHSSCYQYRFNWKRFAVGGGIIGINNSVAYRIELTVRTIFPYYLSGEFRGGT